MFYQPRGGQPGLDIFVVKAAGELVVRSKSRRMRLYLDGPDTMVKVGLGDVVTFSRSEEPLTLYGISLRRKWLQLVAEG